MIAAHDEILIGIVSHWVFVERFEEACHGAKTMGTSHWGGSRRGITDERRSDRYDPLFAKGVTGLPGLSVP